MSWNDDAADLGTDLAFWHVGQSGDDYPIEQLGELSSSQATKFRALAIMQLLGEGSTDLFLHNLMRASRTQKWYLTRVRREKFNDLFFAASGRVAPLLDAIAANDFDTARDLAAMSAPTLQLGEYEDDHHYGKALHALVQDPPDLSSASQALDAMEVFLAGESSPRLEVSRSVISSDQAAFERAFEAFLRAFADSIDKARKRFQLEDGVVLALREVSVEGLALLRLAEHQGLTTEREYPYCPSLARRPMTVRFQEV
jgi:hypothetical protein